ncbi:hypothetical protein C8Q80DRAFT_729224 [Daedaleopsis nitida]|nr:hypothetical protein C8Q80DRAFT_729224 [Daedaleopsis nitida]
MMWGATSTQQYGCCLGVAHEQQSDDIANVACMSQGGTCGQHSGCCLRCCSVHHSEFCLHTACNMLCPAAFSMLPPCRPHDAWCTIRAPCKMSSAYYAHTTYRQHVTCRFHVAYHNMLLALESTILNVIVMLHTIVSK